MYGYLPAILSDCPNSVILPVDYKKIIEQRIELQPFMTEIKWLPSIEQCFAAVTKVVLATTPAKQPDIAMSVLTYPNVKELYLEKPLAVDPVSSDRLLEKLNGSQIKFRINYSFFYCAWFEKFRRCRFRENDEHLSLDWHFKASHFLTHNQTWKKNHAAGGGVLRFYGIHLIALLAKLGYTEVSFSSLTGELLPEPAQWTALFHGGGVKDCRVTINSNSNQSCFSVDQIGVSNVTRIIDLVTPFDLEAPLHKQDSRVNILRAFLSDANVPDADLYGWYEATNKLWSGIETY